MTDLIGWLPDSKHVALTSGNETMQVKLFSI